ncbi:MAG: 2-oxo-4-hydroxy-4-carboxy-5-ureidoimidazoline decarboxylase [Exilibacterium sp.]
MNLEAFNQLHEAEARRLLTQCCAATTWVERMLAARPFTDSDSLLRLAAQHWKELGEADYLQAFAAHPQIGAIDSLREKYTDTKTLAGGEQAGVDGADEATLQALAAGNNAYRDKFGFIFIVCATGKSAAEMLQLLQQRLPNERAVELRNAAEQQHKITRIRLEQLLL